MRAHQTVMISEDGQSAAIAAVALYLATALGKDFGRKREVIGYDTLAWDGQVTIVRRRFETDRATVIQISIFRG